jgi:hypothetical protein
MMLGALAGGASASLSDAIGHIWHTGADVGAIKSKMLQQGYTQAQVDNAMASAINVQHTISGATIPGAMEAQLDLNSIMRNPDKAAQALPEFAGLGVVLSQYGKGGQLKTLFEAMQAGELRGALIGEDGQLSVDRLANFVHMLEARTIATGGRDGPHETLAMMQNAGVASRVISDKDLAGMMIPVELSMGAAKAGTGLQALFQHFGVGKGSDASWNFLNEMGLLDDPDLGVKYGIGQRLLLPGGLKGEDMMKSGDVFGFIEKVLLPAAKAYNIKHYGHTDSKMDSTTAQVLSSRIPEAKFLADAIALLPLSKAYSQSVEATSQRDVLGIAQDTNPQLAAQGLGASIQGLVLALSDPNMAKATGEMKTLSGVLNLVSDAARKVPSIPDALGDQAVYTAGFAALISLFALAKIAVKAMGDMAPMLGQLYLIGTAAIAAYKAAGFVNEAGNWVMDHIDPANKDNRAAVQKYNPFDRSTWADPNSSWFNSGPKIPGVSGYTNGGATPVYLVNHADVGNAVSGGMANGATKPATGPSFFNGAMDLPPYGGQ